MPDPRKERARTRIVLEGDVPSPAEPAVAAAASAPAAGRPQEICAEEEPALIDRGQGHPVACHFAEVAAVV